MEMKYLVDSKALIVRLRGELDHHSAETIRRRVDGDIQRLSPRALVFDFSDVRFMDSSGIGIIMGRYKNILRVNGKTLMVSVRPEVKKVFDISGITKIIPYYDNLNQALDSI